MRVRSVVSQTTRIALEHSIMSNPALPAHPFTASRLALFILGCLLSMLAACGGTAAMDGDDGNTCGDDDRSGHTQCVGNVCNAGQYCDMSTFPTCTPGCTSDENCGPGDVCARATGAAVGVCQACPVCGNGRCDGDETAASCPRDCKAGPVCGNHACEAGESTASCATDCPAAAVCGNGRCETGESTASCAADCPAPAVCGNGRCETGESTSTCAADCKPVCGDGLCDTGESPQTCNADCLDLSLAQCRFHCEGWETILCLDHDGRGKCEASCEAATIARREAFNTCASTSIEHCPLSCLDKLK
jgi:hypothetical protein